MACLAAASAPPAHAQSSGDADQVPAGPTRLLRFADISKDKVVFAYAGDLWIASREGGAARRLTSHAGDELYPKFSPDGKWIAFTGEYDGNPDVYVILRRRRRAQATHVSSFERYRSRMDARRQKHPLPLRPL